MKTSTHNTEQSARGYLMYQLARRGYLVQPTDSHFPTEDLLCVSPEGKHFGIDVKGQQTKSPWLLKEPIVQAELFYVFIYVPTDPEVKARVFIMTSEDTYKAWQEKNAEKTNEKGSSYPYDISWQTPHLYEDRYDLLPK